jgi:hypothetical protein
MTTEQYRKLALEAETALQWGRAIDYWQSAMDTYPSGWEIIGEEDLKQMETSQSACKRMFFPG